MTAPAIFDPGLQPERTQLAWRRTALSVAVGSIVAMRILPAVLGDVIWVVPGVIGVVCAACERGDESEQLGALVLCAQCHTAVHARCVGHPSDLVGASRADWRFWRRRDTTMVSAPANGSHWPS